MPDFHHSDPSGLQIARTFQVPNKCKLINQQKNKREKQKPLNLISALNVVKDPTPEVYRTASDPENYSCCPWLSTFLQHHDPRAFAHAVSPPSST